MISYPETSGDPADPTENVQHRGNSEPDKYPSGANSLPRRRSLDPS